MKRTYWLKDDPSEIYVLNDYWYAPNLKNTGWRRITRAWAQHVLGGPKYFEAALQRCGGGRIYWTGNQYRCHGPFTS